MTDLTVVVPSLKRALAVPGVFDDTFPDTLDTDLVGTLSDAMAEAQLDGFLSTTLLDVDTGITTPDLTRAQQALIVLYGMARVLTAQVANTKNRTRYKAGNVEAESEQSATVIVQLLKDTRDRKKQLLEDARIGRAGTGFTMVDLYVTRSIDACPPEALVSAELQYTYPRELR